MKNRRRLIILSFLMILFLILGFMVRNSSEAILFDMALMKAIHENSNTGLFLFMRIISFLGSGTFLVGLVSLMVVYNLIKKSYFLPKLLLASTLGSYILNFILKLLVNRTRPLDFFLVDQGGLSFPSGHSMVATSMYLILAYILSNKFKDKKVLIYGLGITMILLMGISRLFLGVHWPTDVLGGYIMGYLLYEFIIARIDPKKL